jgi:hypothetical protein
MRNLFIALTLIAIFLGSCSPSVDDRPASPVAPDVEDVLQDAAEINRGEKMEPQENLNITDIKPPKIVGLPGAPGFDEKTFGADSGWIPTSADFLGADILLMDPRISILRFADIPSVTLPDESWSIRKPDQPWPRRVNSTALEFGNYIFERDGYSYKINLHLNQISDNISALRDDGMGIRFFSVAAQDLTPLVPENMPLG